MISNINAAIAKWALGRRREEEEKKKKEEEEKRRQAAKKWLIPCLLKNFLYSYFLEGEIRFPGKR